MADYDKLTIKIVANTGTAIDSIERLSSRLDKLEQQAQKMDFTRLEKLQKILQDIASVDFTKVSGGLWSVAKSFEAINDIGKNGGFTAQMKEIADTTSESAEQMESQWEGVKIGINSTSRTFDDFIGIIQKGNEEIAKLNDLKSLTNLGGDIFGGTTDWGAKLEEVGEKAVVATKNLIEFDENIRTLNADTNGADASLERIGEALQRIGLNGSQMESVFNTLGKETSKLSSSQVDAVERAMKKLGYSAEQVKYTIQKLGQETKKATSSMSNGLGKVAIKFKSLALYRVLRLILMKIQQELTKSLQKLAQSDSGFNDSLSRLSSSFTYLADSFMGMLSPLLQSITPILETIIDSLSQVLQFIGEIFAALTGKSYFAKPIKEVKDYAKELEKAKNIMLGIDELNVIQKQDEQSSMYQMVEVEVQSSGALGELFAKIEEAFKTIFAHLQEALMPLVDDIVEMLDKIYPIVGTLVEWASKLISTVIDVLAPILESVIGFITQVIEAIGVIVEALNPVIDIISKLLASIGNLINSILSPLLDLLGDIITKLGGFIADLLGALQPLFDSLFDLVDSLLGSLADLIGPLIDDIAEMLGPILDTVLSGLTDIVGDLSVALAPVIDNISEILNAAVGLIGDIIDSALTIIKPILEALTDILSAVFDIVGSLIEAVSPILDTISGIITDTLVPIYQELGDIIGEFATKLGGAISEITTALKPVLNTLATIIGQVLELLSPILETLAGIAGELISGVLQTALSIIEPLFNFLSTILQPVLEAIKFVLELIKPILDVISSVLDFLKPVFDGINAILSPIRDLLRKIAGVDGPSTFDPNDGIVENTAEIYYNTAVDSTTNGGAVIDTSNQPWRTDEEWQKEQSKSVWHLYDILLLPLSLFWVFSRIKKAKARMAEIEESYKNGTRAIRRVIDTTENVFAKLREFANTLDTVFNTEIFSNLAEKVITFSQKITEFVDNIKNALSNGVEKINNLFENTAFANLIEMLLSKITEFFSGLIDGIKNIIEKVRNWFSGIIDTLRQGIESIAPNLGGNISNAAQTVGGAIAGVAQNVWSNIVNFFSGSFANGGFVEDGFFFANSSELVGRFSNGKTTVANNEEITQGIYQAVLAAMNDANSENTRDIVVQVDGREIARVAEKYQAQKGANMFSGGKNSGY